MTAPVRSGTGLICLTEAVNAAAALDAAARLGLLEFRRPRQPTPAASPP